MLLPTLILVALVVQQTAGKETKELTKDQSTSDAAASTVEGKNLGGGYGYSPNGGYGPNGGFGGNKGYGRSYNSGYSSHGNGGYRGDHHGHHGGNHGDYHGHHHDHHEAHQHKLVPIKIPYIDQNGCRFPGEPVCDVAGAAARNTYVRCLLANENKNLWKKPTFQASNPITCDLIIGPVLVPTPAFVPTDFCNNNKRLLKAAGLIQDKDEHGTKRFHQGLFTVSTDPCFLGA